MISPDPELYPPEVLARVREFANDTQEVTKQALIALRDELVKKWGEPVQVLFAIVPIDTKRDTPTGILMFDTMNGAPHFLHYLMEGCEDRLRDQFETTAPAAGEALN